MIEETWQLKQCGTLHGILEHNKHTSTKTGEIQIKPMHYGQSNSVTLMFLAENNVTEVLALGEAGKGYVETFSLPL